MAERKAKTIYFPHVIPGGLLAGHKFTYNNINGGMKRVADFGLDPTTFFGGNALELGMIREYGFYAIPSTYTGQILGFYLYDPATVTDEGKKILERHFVHDTLVYSNVEEVAAVTDDPEKRAKLMSEYEEMGGAPGMVRNVHVDELKAMIDALKSGEAKLPYASVEAPANNNHPEDAKVTKPVSKGRPSKDIVAQVRKASAK